MFLHEAKLTSRVRHPSVVSAIDVVSEDDELFIVMDYVEGASLADVRKELSSVGRAIDPRFAVRIALDALAGLQAAHVLHDEKG
jgi:serine/threonine-protein kinase